MMRRWGWVALAAFSGLFLVVTAISGAWAVGLAVSDGPFLALVTLVPVAVGLLFWRWIALGAWLRAYPPLDPDTGEPVRQPEEVGPWGVVGRVLLGLMVIGFVTVGVAGTILERRSTDRADEVREQAERVARRQGLTAADVSEAVDQRRIWVAVAQGQGPDPLQRLLPVPDAEVVDASTDDGGAAVLLRPTEGPPCVVVIIDRNALVRSRLVDTCST